MSQFACILSTGVVVIVFAAVSLFASIRRLFPLATWCGAVAQGGLAWLMLSGGVRWVGYMLFCTTALGVGSALLQYRRMKRTQ
jgi:hypothetical protein